ncbi:MAG TPA: enoyl-CoA hydratase/isomerase family protein [Terriglobales bacterium]|nr:enoyl-CoA hydratase/isomerase family protein [Terriglobales bacterium]
MSDLLGLETIRGVRVLRLLSTDGTNRLTRACVKALVEALQQWASPPKPFIVTGNERCFSAGADLQEIAALTGVSANDFSQMGQQLMRTIECFPAPVYAAISGYCFGGGLDLALACHRRIASPNAVLGHRGASLGLVTGWGGTQRLPRLIGKSQALSMFVSAEKIDAAEALRLGLVDGLAADPVPESIRRIVAAARHAIDL